MMNIQTTQLNVYPLKSCQGNAMTEAKVQLKGLNNDRRFLLVNNKGGMITGRTHPTLTKLRVKVTDTGIEVSAPQKEPLVLHYADFSEQYITAKVWASVNQGQHCGEHFDQWFSDYLGLECQLVFFGEKTAREIKDYPQQVSFADGYPLLLIGEASLAELNRRATQTHQMAQFRPNIVVNGEQPFAEDGWSKIRIGEVEFIVHRPCSRCNFTQLNLATGKRFASGEPLSILNQFRRGQDGKAYFGQNLIPLNEGVIKVGDEIEVVEVKAPELYDDLMT